MTKKDRDLLRAFYQSIPTEEEKAAYMAVLGASREDKVRYILVNAPLGMDEQTKVAILAATSLTKEYRAIIAGAIARGVILKFFSWITGGGWA